MKTDKIVIVGGGSAGWMTAATLIKHFPNKDISLIESPDVPIVGVGESTIGQINEWLDLLDIKDEDFMKDTDASYKLSISFTDWAGKDSGSFHYPFGTPWTVGTSFGLNDWFIKKAWYPETPVQDWCDCYFPQMSCVYDNKITENSEEELPLWSFKHDVAYHFDAAKFGAWLREKYCIPRGVKHIAGTINEDVSTNEQGIEYVELTTGEKIYADLFIDCTGWKSLLLGKTLGVEFESYSDILPNNKAWATRIPYQDKEKELEGYTDCIARENGWVWNIPLWSRVGTGYVYSDQYISDAEALEQYKDFLRTDRKFPVSDDVMETLEFKNISMRVGIHKEIFHKNCVAVGLSAGFIEPLESNGLFTVHEFLGKLVKTLGRPDIGMIDRAGFNASARGDFRSFAEFVSIHYLLSTRDDTQYWRDAKERKFSKDDNTPGMYLSYGFDNLIYHRDVINSFDQSQGGAPAIAVGLGHFPMDASVIKKTEYRQRKSLSFVNDTIEIWENNKEYWKRVADSSPTIYEYLKEKYGEQ